MATEEELQRQLVQNLQQVARTVNTLRRGMNDRRLEQLRRSEIRDWQRHDPEANTARTGISDRDWERRVTMAGRNPREPQARSDTHRNHQQGQAQSQGEQKPELSAELQKLRSLSQGGQQSALGAAKPPTHAPEAMPHSGATTAGRQHQNSSQGPGRKQDTSPGRDHS